MFLKLNKILTRAKKNKGVSHTSLYAIGSITRQLVGFLMLPIYTSYLTPADYGLVGLFLFAISILEGIFGARLMDSVPKFYHEQSDSLSKNLVISSALWITSIASSLIVGIAIFYSESFSKIIVGSSEYALIFSLFAVQILTQAIEFYGMLYLRIVERPVLFLVLNLLKMAVQLLLNVWFVVYLELGVLGIAWSGVIATTLFAIGVGGYCVYKTGFGFDKALGKKLLIFSWPLWLAGLGGLYINASNRYYINLFSSLDEVGLYALGAQFALILMVIFWMPFNQYWSIQRFKTYKEEDAVNKFRGVFKIMSALLGLGCIGISILSVPVIYWMADSSFHEAVIVVPILVVGIMFFALAEFFNFGFFVKSRTGLVTKNSYISAALVTILYFILIPEYGYIGAAISLMCVQIFQFLYSYFLSQRFFKLDGVWPHLAYVFFVMVGVVYYTNFYLYQGMESNQLSEIAIRILMCILATVLLLGKFIDYKKVQLIFRRQFRW